MLKTISKKSRKTEEALWPIMGRAMMGGLLILGALLVEGAGTVRLYIVASGLAAVTCIAAAVTVYRSRGQADALLRRPVLGTGWGILMALFGLVWIVRSVLDYQEMDLLGYGTKLGISYLTLLIVGALFVGGRYFKTVEEVCLAIVLGIAAYGAANLVAQAIGLTPGHSEEQIERFRSRFEYADFRWLPPLANSNGAFSMLNVFAMGLAMRIPFFTRGRLQWVSSVVVLISICVLGVCAILVQFRGTTVVLMASLVWIAVGQGRWRILIDAACVVAMLIIPLLFVNLAGCKLLEQLLPRKLVESLGTNPEMVFTLSGRAYLYNYGVELLHNPHTFFLGDGPAKRDATPGLLEGGLEEIGMTIGFHQSLLDLIIPHGIFAALAVLLTLARLIRVVIFGFRRRWFNNRVHGPVLVAALAPVGVVASGSLIDGPLGYFPILFLALLPAFSSILPIEKPAPAGVASDPNPDPVLSTELSPGLMVSREA